MANSRNVFIASRAATSDLDTNTRNIINVSMEVNKAVGLASPQFPYNHPIEQAPMYPFFTKQKVFEFRAWKEQERRTMGASTQVDARRLKNSGSGIDTNKNKGTKKDPYKFSIPDKKSLRVLLKKELKNSDVGSFGRIVLPKLD
ncbi:hypothetical protein GOBAR_DD31020 [Gossypium barbadense]|nr:hypothetical protein GOBAR_DD31020 [Gossypium barbadense]